jgi:hypothetical protein
MARIIIEEAQAWGEATKLKLATLDTYLLANIEEEVIGQLAGTYDTSTWLDPTSTPKLIRVIISKMYVSWFYNRTYSEDTDKGNPYASALAANAAMLIAGIIDGTITIPGTPNQGEEPSFYPTDNSSIQKATCDDPSLGPAHFSMWQTF